MTHPVDDAAGRARTPSRAELAALQPEQLVAVLRARLLVPGLTAGTSRARTTQGSGAHR